ncbi:MAG TPA: hypothetical protein VG122_00340, partial [Gemmata sp.]|nr:hypothetical protein [Gemmata sp.]
MAESLDWSKLPTSLSWLAEPAEQYGHLQFDDPIYDYLRRVGPDERVALRELGERWGKAWEDINRWLDAYP